MMNRRQFILTASALSVSAQQDQHARWIATAESLRPRLKAAQVTPVAHVRPEPAPGTFLRWRMERVPAPGKLLRRGDSFILDFGTHLTGYFAFFVEGEGEAVDAPVRLRFTFGEAPADVAVPFDTYKGTLALAWLPEEILNIDFLPRRVEVPRRHAFRYVKVDVVDTSPNFGIRFRDFSARAVTSAQNDAPALPAGVPDFLRRIDAVGLRTLRDCMQTVFEDGPRRDRRLWIGDLRLQALTNYCTFRNNDLVKRCLYLFAGLPREDGLVAACVYDEPKPLCGRQFIMDYAVLFGSTVLDYVRATGDTATARELWPVARRQFELVGKFVNADGLFTDPKDWWIFIDWREELEKSAAMHGVLLFGYQQALELARIAGAEKDAAGYADRIALMTAAARARFYDPKLGVFVSGPARQVSWATQAWMVHSGVATREQGATALRKTMQIRDAVRPGTPYLYHYFVDAMLACGLKDEAREMMRTYWGGMVDAGADTFWEIYDPSNPLLSPYKDVLVNSYCHAWSCTPSYFIRARGLV